MPNATKVLTYTNTCICKYTNNTTHKLLKAEQDARIRCLSVLIYKEQRLLFKHVSQMESCIVFFFFRRSPLEANKNIGLVSGSLRLCCSLLYILQSIQKTTTNIVMVLLFLGLRGLLYQSVKNVVSNLIPIF